MCCLFSFNLSSSLQNSLVANCWDEIWKKGLYISSAWAVSHRHLTAVGADWFTEVGVLGKGPQPILLWERFWCPLGWGGETGGKIAAIGTAQGAGQVWSHWHVKCINSPERKVMDCFSLSWGVYLKPALNNENSTLWYLSVLKKSAPKGLSALSCWQVASCTFCWNRIFWVIWGNRRKTSVFPAQKMTLFLVLLSQLLPWALHSLKAHKLAGLVEQQTPCTPPGPELYWDVLWAGPASQLSWIFNCTGNWAYFLLRSFTTEGCKISLQWSGAKCFAAGITPMSSDIASLDNFKFITCCPCTGEHIPPSSWSLSTLHSKSGNGSETHKSWLSNILILNTCLVLVYIDLCSTSVMFHFHQYWEMVCEEKNTLYSTKSNTKRQRNRTWIIWCNHLMESCCI